MEQHSRLLFDEPDSVYYQRKLHEANHSGLRVMGRSPAHFRYWALNPDQDKETESLAFGKMFHCATLEPEMFDRRYCLLPRNAPARPTARQWNARSPSKESAHAQDWWTLFEHEHPGVIIVSPADYDKAQRMGDSIRNHSRAVAGMLVGGHREATIRWIDKETGVHCKARIDILEPCEYMIDLKKTVDASPEAFARSISHYEYDQQAAHYCDGHQVKHFIFLACEDTPPYVCQPYFLDGMAQDRGMALRRQRIRRQAKCLETGVWPGYSTSIEQISLPTWAFYSNKETEIDR